MLCTLLLLQLRREFRAIAAIDGRATSLMSSWPDWVERLVQFSKAEAATRPVIRKLLLEYEAGAGMDNPTGLWSACEGLMFMLLCHVLLDLMAWSNWLCGSLIPGPKEEEGPDFSYCALSRI